MILRGCTCLKRTISKVLLYLFCLNLLKWVFLTLHTHINTTASQVKVVLQESSWGPDHWALPSPFLTYSALWAFLWVPWNRPWIEIMNFQGNTLHKLCSLTINLTDFRDTWAMSQVHFYMAGGRVVVARPWGLHLWLAPASLGCHPALSFLAAVRLAASLHHTLPSCSALELVAHWQKALKV